jgi:hypothetical protein
VLLFQRFPQRVEHGRQLPAAKNIGMIQSRRPPLETFQIVVWHQDLLVPAIRARVGGDHLTSQHDVDAVHVGLDGHLLKGGQARHAVAVGVEAHHLVLIDLGRLKQTRIEGRGRK